MELVADSEEEETFNAKDLASLVQLLQSAIGAEAGRMAEKIIRIFFG